MVNTQPTQTSASLDRIMPHNEDAERAILGAILLDHQVLHEIYDYIDDSSFYHTGHSIIYRAIQELYKKNSSIDVVTLTEELSSRGKLDSVGGAFYLTTLVENIVTTSNAKHHAEIVRDKATVRRLIQASNKISEMSYNPLAEADTVIEESERLIFDIAQRKDQRDIQLLSDLLTDGMDRI